MASDGTGKPSGEPVKLGFFQRNKQIFSVLAWVFVALFGTGIIYRAYESYQALQPAKFTVSVMYALDDQKEYEITDFQSPEIPFNDVTFKSGIEVLPAYQGKPMGKVIVRVRDQNDLTIAESGWESFSKDSTSLIIPLDPSRISNMVEQVETYQEPDGIYRYPKAVFPIEIYPASDPSHPLYTDTLTILNTPWYHWTQVSANYLWENNLQVYVKGENLGGPSQFFVITEVYEITDTAGKPQAPWPKIGWDVRPIPGIIERGGEYQVQVNYPVESNYPFTFEPGKCYAIHTYVSKKQNFVDTQGNDWGNLDELWRFADLFNDSLVCWPTK